MDGLLAEAPRDTARTLLQRRNLRDLGGLPTRNGLVVRPRRLFRSSSPALFNKDEQRELLSLELRGAIDLRTTAEHAQSDASALPANVRELKIPLFETIRSNWVSPSDQSPKATAGRYFEMVEDSLQALAVVVRTVGEPNMTPVVVSCTAGRDRTGIVVICLLDLLDVTDDAIAADYAYSDPFDPKSGRAHAATVHELLALIRRRFDTSQRMLAPQGITSGMVEALRRDLLGPS